MTALTRRQMLDGLYAESGAQGDIWVKWPDDERVLSFDTPWMHRVLQGFKVTRVVDLSDDQVVNAYSTRLSAKN